MQLGIDNFAAVTSDPFTGAIVNAAEQLNQLVDQIVVADEVGLDSFGIGEHHRRGSLDSAQTLILAAAAYLTALLSKFVITC